MEEMNIKVQIKFVVWGMGSNGANLIDILGNESVFAIIESDEKKIKLGFYNETPIIDFDTYLKKYTEYYVIITPMIYQEIENKMKYHGISKYFILARNPVKLLVFSMLKKDLFIKKYSIDEKKKYIIIGHDLFCILLYRYLFFNNISTKICCMDYNKAAFFDELINSYMIDGYCQEIPDEEDICFIKTDNNQSLLQKNLKGRTLLDSDFMNAVAYLQWKYDLEKFKDCHIGERVFIVATGPSLKAEDLERLYKNHDITISMNCIYYIFPKTNWRPNYYVASDGNMLRIYEKIEESERWFEGTEKFFSDNYLKFWDNEHNNSYHCFKQEQGGDLKFSDNFSEVVYSGLSVVYACLQLAVYMGFKEIYLLGTDFDFSPNFDSANDHFYKDSYQYYTFDYDYVLKSYLAAKKYADDNDIKIMNATRGGKLEVFSRVDFDHLV